jgi:magnesium chelatase family protein
MYVSAYAPFGSEGILIRVEVDIRRGIPGFDITGLADGAVREARERVRSAFRNSSFPFPSERILVNLAPAGFRKEGASLDLPIALAIMAASGLVPWAEGLMVLGELELSGRLRGVRGVLAATASGLKTGIRAFIVPRENGTEAAILAQGRFAAVETLRDAVYAMQTYAETGCFIGRSGEETPTEVGSIVGQSPRTDFKNGGDFSEVRGNRRYKRALEIAAAGGHNLLVFGPPGSGKTMLARRFPSIMAPLTVDEAVEATRLHSLAGALGPADGLVEFPPFRSPHHSASAEGILGGGRNVRPGEISLAHLGVLFMDEAPEFRTNVLQALREPLEDGVVTIARAEGFVRLPADFQLIMAANPCACGRLGARLPLPGRVPVVYSYGAGCFCSEEEIHRRWRRLGSALLDRLELRVPIGPPLELPLSSEGEESSAKIAQRVFDAVEIQRRRFMGTGIRRNARMPPAFMERYSSLKSAAERAFRDSLLRWGFSGRGAHGILRVARTIADLERVQDIRLPHIEEAVLYRRFGDDPYDVLSAENPGIPSA